MSCTDPLVAGFSGGASVCWLTELMGLNAMNDLDTLRPEVREALDRLVYFLTGTHNHNDFYTIRAELLRLAGIEAYFELHAPPTPAEWHAANERAEKAEAELAALKARIAEAPVYEIPVTKPRTETGWAGVVESVKNLEALRGKRVLLVVEE